MQQHCLYRRALLATLVSSLLHATAIAQEAPMATISVTASPISAERPLNATTADEQLFSPMQSSTSDSASLLQSIPGVQVQGAGGVSGLPVVQGVADDRLRIKVDGMDLISACGNHMNPPLSYIDPSHVDNITVYAGISPVSVGGDSIGSTILVDSADPKFADPGAGTLTTGEFGLFLRSNGNVQGGNLAATVASESVSLTYSGSTTEADNYHAGDTFKTETYANDVSDRALDGDEVGSTMYQSTNQSLALAMRKENHLVELKVGIQDIPYQGYVNQRMDMTGNDSTQTNLRYTGEYDWGGLEASAYKEHTRHRMQFFDDKLYWYGSNTGVPTADGEPCTPAGGNNGCAAGMPMDTEGDNTGAVLKAELPLSSRDLLRVGTELQQYRLDDWWDPSGKGMWPETFWNIRDGERDRSALFAEWEAQWSPQWLTQVGVRGEKVEMNSGEVQGYATATSAAPWNTMIAPKYIFEADTFNSADREFTDNNLDVVALARFTPSERYTIEFGAAQKTRSPNLYERYTWSTNGMSMRMINWAGDGNGYVGNLELEPEVAHTLSASFDWHGGAAQKWGLKIAPYYTVVDDYIDARRCGPTDVAAGTTSSACTTANLTATEQFVYLKFVNQSATIYGVDISGHMPVAEDTAYGNFKVTGQLSYVRGVNDDTDDNLYNMVPLNAKLALVQQRNGWSNTAEVEIVDDKKDVSAVRNELETKGYELLHLRSSYAMDTVRIDFGIENVLDEFYNDPLGGVYLGEGKTMAGTAVSWGTAAPGMGRSFYLGMNIEF